MACLSLPLRVLQSSDILVHTHLPAQDQATPSYSIRPTSMPTFLSAQNIEIRVQSGSDANGPYIAISLASSMQLPASTATYHDQCVPTPSDSQHWSLGYQNNFVGDRSQTTPDGSIELFDPVAYSMSTVTIPHVQPELSNIVVPNANPAWECHQPMESEFFGMSPQSDDIDIPCPALEQAYPVASAIIQQPTEEYPVRRIEPQLRTPRTSPSCASDEDDDDDERGGRFRSGRKLARRTQRVPSRPPRRPTGVITGLPCHFPPCEAQFSRQHDRLRHEVGKHGRKCEWTCNICKRFFSNSVTLDRHKCGGIASNYDRRYLPQT